MDVFNFIKEKRKEGKKERARSSGFTLIETLVAIAILMIAIAGPLTVAEKGLTATYYSRNQLIGSYLAQDGIEYIKNLVDSNEIYISDNPGTDTGDKWTTAGGHDLSTYCTSTTPCVVDSLNNTITQCTSVGACPTIYLGTKGYTQNSLLGSATSFTRYFYVVPFNVNGGSAGNTYDAVNAVVTVSWLSNGAGSGSVTLEDAIFDTPLQ